MSFRDYVMGKLFRVQIFVPLTSCFVFLCQFENKLLVQKSKSSQKICQSISQRKNSLTYLESSEKTLTYLEVFAVDAIGT